ncbi:FAD-dependent oxidoreductase [Puteibacter caeruleilacunae]|nr:FAD-dependent oxidoreductase [Puteibacter caeruleilacunae]
MLAKKYKSEVVGIENPFEGVYTVEFKPFRGRYRYAPGQFLHVAIDRKYDGIGQWPESRCFSMQSNGSAKTIKVTYAVKGEFTTEMEKELQVGQEVWLKLPYGDLFSQTHNKKNTVFISGGTGITPFLSLFTDTSFGEYENPKLYMGFKEASLQIYNQELAVSQEINRSLDITTFYENVDGIIDIERILKENDKTSSFFVSGPPVMIKNFKEFLIQNGVDEENVKTDDWE